MNNKKCITFLTKQWSKLSRQDGFWIMSHTLLRDAFILSLIAFVGLVTLEGVMPGFVSVRINLAKVIFVVAFLQLVLLFVEHKRSFLFPTRKPSRWILFPTVVWSLVIIANALAKFPIEVAGITFTLTLIIGILFYREFFHNHDAEN